MNTQRRVVVTGMGAVSAAGIGADALWRAARDGRSCVSETQFNRPYRGRIKISAQVQGFDPAAHIEAAVLPFCDPVTQYLLTAADEAVAQAGLSRAEPMGPRTASIIGTGVGGMHTLEDGLYLALVEQGRPAPLTVPRLIPSSPPSNVSIRYGATGPCFAVASACSSATQAIGIAAQLIRWGVIDRAIVGGTEDCITNSALLAWEALRVLTPDACRPFSKGRNGMILGAGAAVFILEAEDIALARGAVPLVELAGYGTTADAKDQVRPDAKGAAACMSEALRDAGVAIDEIDYINAHGTGTTVNDITEAEALGLVFGARAPQLPVSSTKPIHGHGLGAGGALELVVTIGAVRNSIAPPTINWREPDIKCPVDAVPNEARPMPIRTAMSNSFAFGGINASLVVRRAEAA
ncbi:Beta-ketoacyl synthase [Methylocella silvestris BL2]|uniref:Nodulation protein E n=1 Tax=Methylocella silvestris (strain DSM 15510 / CIP 108128 / LMG 27833 / NCIMB 13906 / BL2) TaxID=395965 RepID=B8EPI7_METSB|nr:beta-ketoacyl-[acyl-carrier-protein] synthase family protein [Methylocella silvestris]ACK50192.1 Beta-ketoacyl synthase [Methylocella silvestris BL2]